jgi:choline dehydrogenase
VQFDYIIVGAGSAGCVLANRLTASGKHSVLLLEAGVSDRNPLLRVPILGSMLGVNNPKYDWMYKTAPDPSRKGRTEIWPRGKLLGGSSSINGTIYVRGARDDYNGWSQLGNAGWSFEDVEPVFERMEKIELGPGAKESDDSPLNIRPVQGAHNLSHKFVAACAEAGVRPNPDYNGAAQEGAAILNTTSTGRVRQSASQAYLMPARRRSNLTVLTSAQATKIVLEGKRATGVEFQHKGKAATASANKEIILCGGSINSPQLLMLSGIGPAAHLRDKGLDVALDLPGVGENLHEHPCLTLQARVKGPAMGDDIGSLRGKLRVGLRWALKAEGPLTAVVFQALAFVKTSPELSYPDIQVHFAPLGYGANENGVFIMDKPTVTLQPNVNRPRSRGRLSLASKDPLEYPVIDANMLGDPYDLSTLIAAGKFVRRLYETDALKDQFIQERLPGAEVNSEDEWEDFVRQAAGPTFHPVGTCKMGTDASAVVGPDLKVRGIQGLRVADGSIMPQVVSGNTNAACMMIGEKAAELILG